MSYSVLINNEYVTATELEVTEEELKANTIEITTAGGIMNWYVSNEFTWNAGDERITELRENAIHRMGIGISDTYESDFTFKANKDFKTRYHYKIEQQRLNDGAMMVNYQAQIFIDDSASELYEYSFTQKNPFGEASTSQVLICPVLWRNASNDIIGFTILTPLYFLDSLKRPFVWIRSAFGANRSCANDVFTMYPADDDFAREITEDAVPDLQPGGGYGTRINPTDSIALPELPSFNMQNIGARLYELTEEQANAFSSWLWTSDWTENIKKITNDPIESVNGFFITDCPTTIYSAGTIWVGNIDSGCGANLVNTYATVDCGTVNAIEYYANFGDYAPYTHCYLYLPKVGLVSIDSNALINNNINVTYMCDLFSGEGICFVRLKNTRNGFTYIYNSYPCSLYESLPLTASNHSQRLLSFANTLASAVSAPVTGNVGGLVASAFNTATTPVPIERLGSFSGFSAICSVKKPFLIFSRTNLVKSSKLNADRGQSSFIAKKISECTGYIQTTEFHVEFDCPEFFANEIENLMNNGVLA